MQFLRVHVDLRRAQRRVAEQRPHDGHGLAAVDELHGAAVPERVGCCFLPGGAPRALVPAPHVVVESRPREGFPWLLSHTGSSRRDRRRVSRRGWRRTRPASWRLPGRGEQSRTAPPLPVTRTYGSSTSRTRSRIRRPHSSPARIPVRRGELRTRCPARATPSGPSDSGSRRRRGRLAISASRSRPAAARCPRWKRYVQRAAACPGRRLGVVTLDLREGGDDGLVGGGALAHNNHSARQSPQLAGNY